MGDSLKKILVLILFTLLVGCATTQSKQKNNNSTEIYPTDFNFIFSYGVLKKNQLNTLNNSFTKDLIIDGLKTIELKMTEAEKKQIFMYMEEINLFEYSNEIEGMRLNPESGYEFDITYNGIEKKVRWIGEFNNTQRDNEFKNLTKMIIEIIKAKDEYKELPETNGYYE